MNANLQFRICLRVQNIEASRAMLRRPDAAYLPTDWRGRGYFQVGAQGMFKQFQTANVVAEYDANPVTQEVTAELDLFVTKNFAIPLITTTTNGNGNGNGSKSPAEPVAHGRLPSEAEVISQTITEYARQQNLSEMRQILLPPLETPVMLGEIFARFASGGWDGTNWSPAGMDEVGKPIPLGSAPVGLLDDVYNRRQDPLWINLNTTGGGTRHDGHNLILGSPGSGKSTYMRSLAMSLALLHSPDKLNMYFLSFTGTGLNSLGFLPHAERAIHGTETERVRRLFGRLIQILNARQANRETAPTIVLFVDQFEQLRDTYRDTFYLDFERLLQEGRAVGIFIVVSATNADAVPDRLRSIIQQRVALQLGDRIDYLRMVGRIADTGGTTLPPGQGYVFSNPPLLCQISLPIWEHTTADDQATAAMLEALITQLRASYQRLKGLPDSASAQAPAPIRELPLVIPLDTLPVEKGRKLTRTSHLTTPLGRWDDDPLSVFQLNWWDTGPHYIVVGPPGSGKTNLLNAAAISAARHYSPSELRFLLIDFAGRSLRGLDGMKHVIRRVTDVVELNTQLGHLRNELLTFSAQARENEEATFPATVVMIDDYDLTSEALSTDLLTQLRDNVRLFSDFGLYIWVATYLERTNDPLIKQLLLRRSGIGLSTRESLQKLNVRTVGLPAEAMPEGRAFVQVGNQIAVAQTALVTNPADYVWQVNETLWGDQGAARWRYPKPDPSAPASPVPPTPPPPSSTPARPAARDMGIDAQSWIDDLTGKSGQ